MPLSFILTPVTSFCFNDKNFFFQKSHMKLLWRWYLKIWVIPQCGNQMLEEKSKKQSNRNKVSTSFNHQCLYLVKIFMKCLCLIPAQEMDLESSISESGYCNIIYMKYPSILFWSMLGGGYDCAFKNIWERHSLYIGGNLSMVQSRYCPHEILYFLGPIKLKI